MTVKGHVKGYIEGEIDAEINGNVKGKVNVAIDTRPLNVAEIKEVEDDKNENI